MAKITDWPVCGCVERGNGSITDINEYPLENDGIIEDDDETKRRRRIRRKYAGAVRHDIFITGMKQYLGLWSLYRCHNI
jgi:hypothetical protein